MATALPARQRLLETAERLFYDAGITTTGVDTVVREAGVSKPTLYAHFRSKGELVAAVLGARHARRVAELESRVAREADPARRPLAVFDFLATWYEKQGSRGCAFLNAAAELGDGDDAARRAVVAEKRWLADFLAGLVRDAGARDPERVASQLLLLVDGVSGRVVVHGPAAAEAALADARGAAELLLAGAAPGGPA
jgi:AcrR family transcriptional regulator